MPAGVPPGKSDGISKNTRYQKISEEHRFVVKGIPCPAVVGDTAPLQRLERVHRGPLSLSLDCLLAKHLGHLGLGLGVTFLVYPLSFAGPGGEPRSGGLEVCLAFGGSRTSCRTATILEASVLLASRMTAAPRTPTSNHVQLGFRAEPVLPDRGLQHGSPLATQPRGRLARVACVKALLWETGPRKERLELCGSSYLVPKHPVSSFHLEMQRHS